MLFETGCGLDVEAHRVLLKGRDGRRAVVGMGKKLNCSFDLVEWGSSDGVKGLPMQVVWSSGWSNEWSEEGRVVANSLPQASFITHSGGRWPQVRIVNPSLSSLHVCDELIDFRCLTSFYCTSLE